MPWKALRLRRLGRLATGEAGESTPRLLSRDRATVYCLDLTRPESPVLETGPISLVDVAGGVFIRRMCLVWDLTS